MVLGSSPVAVTSWTVSRVGFVSKTAVWQSIPKIVLFFIRNWSYFPVQIIKHKYCANLLEMKSLTDIFLRLWSRDTF